MSQTNLYICPKCGGRLEPDTQTCPYCGYENPGKEQAREEEKLNRLKAEHREKMRKMPREMLKKGTSRIVLLLIFLAVAIAGVFAARYFLQKEKSSAEYSDKQKMLAHLEELYQAGEYEQLKDEYYDSGYYGASFGKYSNTAEIFSRYIYPKKSLLLALESESLCTVNYVSEDLRAAFYCLHRCQDMRDKGFTYGEQEAVEAMEADLLSVLKNSWRMTDEEIAQGFEQYVDRSTDYSELAARLISRLGRKD